MFGIAQAIHVNLRVAEVVNRGMEAHVNAQVVCLGIVQAYNVSRFVQIQMQQILTKLDHVNIFVQIQWQAILAIMNSALTDPQKKIDG